MLIFPAALRRRLLALGAATLAVTSLPSAWAQTQTLNIYSARHYQTDEALYADFTKTTGIKINRIDADDAGILARLKSEGAASPADLILLVDAARLWRAEVDGLFQPVNSNLLKEKIPAHLRSKEVSGASQWFGFSTRARVIVYNKQTVKPVDVESYESLAAPVNKGKVCTRSGSHPYNLSLFGAVMEHLGEAATKDWLTGIVANMARVPKGGDTDQIKATASGECQIALTNTYYLARLMRSDKAEDRATMEKIGIVFPNQKTWGTHVNIAGAGVAKHAKNTGAAVKFLEYLASDSAQRYFADGNNEWPVVRGLKVSNPALEQMGAFKSETIPSSVVGLNQIKVQRLLDQVGYK